MRSSKRQLRLELADHPHLEVLTTPVICCPARSRTRRLVAFKCPKAFQLVFDSRFFESLRAAQISNVNYFKTDTHFSKEYSDMYYSTEILFYLTAHFISCQHRKLS